MTDARVIPIKTKDSKSNARKKPAAKKSAAKDVPGTRAAGARRGLLGNRVHLRPADAVSLQPHVQQQRSRSGAATPR